MLRRKWSRSVSETTTIQQKREVTQIARTALTQRCRERKGPREFAYRSLKRKRRSIRADNRTPFLLRLRCRLQFSLRNFAPLRRKNEAHSPANTDITTPAN